MIRMAPNRNCTTNACVVFLFYLTNVISAEMFRCVIMKLTPLCFCICANNNLNLRAHKAEIFHQHTLECHFAPFIIVFNFHYTNLAYVFKSLNAICSVYKSKPMPKSTPTSTAHCVVWDARLAHVNATNLITQLIIILIKSISICTARIFAYMSYERLLLLFLSSNVPMFTIQCDPNHIECVMWQYRRWWCKNWMIRIECDFERSTYGALNVKYTLL